MKLVNYQLQTQIEQLKKEKSNDYIKSYLQTILEDTSKSYHQRADYIGLSLYELKVKIDNIASNIKELQTFKKLLSESLELAKEITAEVFINNGIDRIDGNIISSLTLTKPSSKIVQDIYIKDANALIRLGYVKFEVDKEAIENAVESKIGLEEIKEFIEISSITVSSPSKIKVNTKRASANNTQINETDEILIIEEEIEKQIAA